MFQFQGYRLAGEGVVSATDGSEIGQTIQGTDDLYEITGEVYWMVPGQNSSVGLRTTVNTRPGQTLVLGASPKSGSSATLLLTVRAEEVPGSKQ